MEKEKRNQIYKTITIVAISVFITFIVTSISLYSYFIKNPISEGTVSNLKNSKDLTSKLQSYREIIDKYYLGEIDEDKLEEGAIKGYIEGLGDPYTEFITKEEMKDYLDDTMGNFVGIGIYMIKNTSQDKIQVLSTIKNSPAEEVGIKAGDLILTVDGVDRKSVV